MAEYLTQILAKRKNADQSSESIFSSLAAAKRCLNRAGDVWIVNLALFYGILFRDILGCPYCPSEAAAAFNRGNSATLIWPDLRHYLAMRASRGALRHGAAIRFGLI
jgi:hypothetical protein